MKTGKLNLPLLDAQNEALVMKRSHLSAGGGNPIQSKKGGGGGIGLYKRKNL